MRIGFDLSITQLNQAGTSVYAQNVYDALAALIADGTLPDLMLLPLSANLQRQMSGRKTLRRRLTTLYTDLWWMHLALPIQAARQKIDLLHMPANSIPLLRPCPAVVFIHDTTIIDTPQHFPFWHRNYARLFTPLAARHAAHILTNSEQSKRDIVRCFGVSPSKITVTYLAANEAYRVLAPDTIAAVTQRHQLNTTDGFILTVGALEPRKNLIRLINAYAKCRANGITAPLVHVGPSGWHFADIQAEAMRLGIAEQVRFLGRLPIEEVAALYNAASAFVYPSLYEGFGLPPLEAMACGAPVITANTSSLPEVVGEAALQVDPLDVDALASAIHTVMTQPALAQTLREHGPRRAAQFSWRRCAQETAQVYALQANSLV